MSGLHAVEVREKACAVFEHIDVELSRLLLGMLVFTALKLFQVVLDDREFRHLVKRVEALARYDTHLVRLQQLFRVTLTQAYRIVADCGRAAPCAVRSP